MLSCCSRCCEDHLESHLLTVMMARRWPASQSKGSNLVSSARVTSPNVGWSYVFGFAYLACSDGLAQEWPVRVQHMNWFSEQLSARARTDYCVKFHLLPVVSMLQSVTQPLNMGPRSRGGSNGPWQRHYSAGLEMHALRSRQTIPVVKSGWIQSTTRLQGPMFRSKQSRTYLQQIQPSAPTSLSQVHFAKSDCCDSCAFCCYVRSRRSHGGPTRFSGAPHRENGHARRAHYARGF